MSYAITFDNSNFAELSKEESLVLDGGGFWNVVGVVAAGVAFGVAACATIMVGAAVVATCIAVSPAAAALCIGAACTYGNVAVTSAAIGYGICTRVF